MEALTTSETSTGPALRSGPRVGRWFAELPTRLKDRDLEFGGALFLIALLPRLFVAIALTGQPVWDGHYYNLGAERIAEGFGYSEEILRDGQRIAKPWSHYPVGYSAWLALFYKIFGTSLSLLGTELRVGPLVGAFTGAWLAFFTHQLARRFLSPGRARLGGLIVALHPGLITYAGLLMTEPLAALLAVVALLAYVELRPYLGRALVTGALVGFATLVRPLSLTLLAALLFLNVPRGQNRVWSAALVAALSALFILPWTVRNCRVMDGCALVSTNGGWNLAIGALTESGRFEALKASDGCPVVTGQVQQDRCWSEVAIAKIMADKARFIRVIPKKLAQTYDHESFPIEYLREARPELWTEEQRTRGREILTLVHRLLLAAAALSFVPLRLKDKGAARLAHALAGSFTLLLALYCFRSDSHPFYLLVLWMLALALVPLPGRGPLSPVERALWVLVALTTVSFAVFFGEDRYHFVLTPVFALFAAGALRTQLPAPRAQEGGA